MNFIDWSSEARFAFLRAVVTRMHQEGASSEEVVVELQNITGVEVEMGVDNDGHPCYQINPYNSPKKGEKTNV